MLDIKELTIYHNSDMKNILQDVNLSLNKGDKIALIGEEGNGKSTLLKAIAGIDIPYATVSGQINNNSIVSYLPQIIDETTKNSKVCELLYDAEHAQVHRLAKEIDLPLADIYDRELSTLSGGEQVKLMLIACIAEHPDALLLDEPTNSLDIPTLEAFERLLNATDIPILFASHDETLISNVANGILYLEQVEAKNHLRAIFTRAPYEEFLQRKNLAYDTQMTHHKKDVEEFTKKKNKYLQIFQRVEHKQNVITRQDPHTGFLLKKKMHTVKSIGRRLEKEEKNLTERPVKEDSIFLYFYPTQSIDREILDIQIDELKTDRVLGKNIQLNVRSKDKIAIVGKNGCGKSTFIRKILPELLNNKKIKVGYMPQNYDEVLKNTTPIKFLERTGDSAERTLNMTILGNLKFTLDEMNRDVKHLSGGQMAKLILAGLVLDRCDVLVLDEPTRNLSPLSGPVIRNILREFDGAIIAVTHDRKLIEEVFTEVYSFESLCNKI